MEHPGHCLDFGRMQSFQLQPSFGAWQSLIIFFYFHPTNPIFIQCVHEKVSTRSWKHEMICNMRTLTWRPAASSVSMMYFVAASRTEIDRLWKRSRTSTGCHECAARLACSYFPCTSTQSSVLLCLWTFMDQVLFTACWFLSSDIHHTRLYTRDLQNYTNHQSYGLWQEEWDLSNAWAHAATAGLQAEILSWCSPPAQGLFSCVEYIWLCATMFHLFNLTCISRVSS